MVGTASLAKRDIIARIGPMLAIEPRFEADSKVKRAVDVAFVDDDE